MEALGLSPIERRLINRWQGGFPLAGRPFALVGRDLGVDEVTIIYAIARLLEQGWLTRFGPLYNAERMGGSLTLAAQEVPEAEFDRVAEIVNAFPEVAHNYRRDHRLNQWFVLATHSQEAMEDAIRRIETATGLKVISFPKEREFFLGLWFEVDERGGGCTRSIPYETQESGTDSNLPLDELDRRIIAATQEGLPLVPDPYRALAERLECLPDNVITRMEAMLSSGAIRRIGLVPNHYRLGFRGNGMTVWDIPDQQLESVGRQVAALDAVSHCYARPRHLPEWPYNLFAMVHGKGREEVQGKVEEIAQLLGDQARAHDTLFSSAVLKKTGLRFGL